MSDIAISLTDISKVYKLYNKHIERLKEAIHPFKKRYHREFYALKNINIKVKKGEIIGIVGRNGSGKSTLLQIISGVRTPSTGKCVVNGNISALLELGGGFNPELTGIENIYLNGTIKGFSRKEMDERLDDILSFAEIGDFVFQPVKTYSNGMRARLGFAAAAYIDPDILILDEVLAVGDELFKRKCFAKMEEFFKAGSTVLYVSHNLNTINEICTRALFLDRGEIILEGQPKQVTQYYQRLLFAKPEKMAKIRKEILEIYLHKEKRKEFASLTAEAEKKQEIHQHVTVKGREHGPRKIDHAYFIAGFEPKSTIVNKNDDVEIFNIQIKTISGKRVNVLVTNEEYIFSFKVRFNTAVENFAFTWNIKNRRGRPLSGVRYPGKNNSLTKAGKNQIYFMEWKFKCGLLRDTYYIDIGVVKLEKGVKKVVSSLNDASVFKVQGQDINKEGAHLYAIFTMEQKLENLSILNE
jgi:lipopolysaccharide transport system ATP-binding protein